MVARLKELKIEHITKKENPNLKRKVYSNNYFPKDVKCLMAKIRKVLNSIETTRVRKAMKEGLKGAHIGCKYFLPVIK
jgi:formylmethanofuran:tetrahydromethanopterin formyltransferase